MELSFKTALSISKLWMVVLLSDGLKTETSRKLRLVLKQAIS